MHRCSLFHFISEHINVNYASVINCDKIYIMRITIVSSLSIFRLHSLYQDTDYLDKVFF